MIPSVSPVCESSQLKNSAPAVGRCVQSWQTHAPNDRPGLLYERTSTVSAFLRSASTLRERRQICQMREDRGRFHTVPFMLRSSLNQAFSAHQEGSRSLGRCIAFVARRYPGRTHDSTLRRIDSARCMHTASSSRPRPSSMTSSANTPPLLARETTATPGWNATPCCRGSFAPSCDVLRCRADRVPGYRIIRAAGPRQTLPAATLTRSVAGRRMNDSFLPILYHSRWSPRRRGSKK